MQNTIQTLDQLSELIENDSNTHKLRDIALLFVGSMIDWPTYNQTRIFDFISELKDFYGSDLSPDMIAAKTIDFKTDDNIWKNESGSSIADMIDLSIIYYGESSFDKIIHTILNYYSDLDLQAKNLY